MSANKRAVIQCDNCGRFMREFPSLTDAARHVDGDIQNIWKACVHKIPFAYGYKWKYADDDKNLSVMEYSMVLERAFSEMVAISIWEMERAKKARKMALSNNEPEPAHYQLVIDALESVKRDFRKRSDEAFKQHCENADVDETGVENIYNAIIERMALDYETALCEEDNGMQNEVKYFAQTLGHKYTDADTEDILSRIEAYHKRFKEKANENIDELIQITDQFRKSRNAFSERNNPHRCPLCGGGMYVKSKLKTNSYLVGCTSCNLTEVVTVQCQKKSS